MLRDKSLKQQQLECVLIDNLVPQDHLLRKIDQYIDFSFIRELTKSLYCENNGRPAIDPEILFKMLFIGYLFGIRSERQLVKDIEVNVAYRWFLGYSLTDKIPDDSTISQNRRRRFKDNDISQKVFDQIVLQAMEHGLVEGKVLYTDSTHLKANANKNKFVIEQVHQSTKSYVEELEKAVNADREAHGKNPFKKDDDNGGGNSNPPDKDVKKSTTDSESGFMVKDNKPKGFFYLDHRTVDGKYNIITDVYVTGGNVNDVDPYLERLDEQIRKFEFKVKYVGLDAGYMTNVICKGLEDRGIKGAIAYRLGPHEKGKFTKTKFQYIKEWDVYACPNGCFLTYRTTTRPGYGEYVSNKCDCGTCPKRELCLTGKNEIRTIRRHVWEEYKDRVIAFTHTNKGKRIYKRRKETVERSFADSKELHGLRYCRMRGRLKVSEQCLLTAAVQNMKKIAGILADLYLTVFSFRISGLSFS
jgi:transposase